MTTTDPAMNALTNPTLAQAAQAYRCSELQLSASTRRVHLGHIKNLCRELGPDRRLDQVTTDEAHEALARRWQHPGTQGHVLSAVRAWLRWCGEQGWDTPEFASQIQRRSIERSIGRSIDGGRYRRAIEGATLGEVNRLRARGLSMNEIAQQVVIPTGPLTGKHPSTIMVRRALIWCRQSPAQAAQALEGIACVVIAYSPCLHRGQRADQYGFHRPHRDTLAALERLRRRNMPVVVTIPGPGRPQPVHARVPRVLREAGARVLTEDQLGHTKPGADYYQAVAQVCQLPPERFLHVGPDLFADVLAPLAAGMRAALVVPDRKSPDDLPDGVPVLGHARELPHLVTQARLHTQRTSAAGTRPR